MKATKWLGFFNTISAYLLPPTAAVVQNNLQSIRPGLLTPRRGLAKRLGSQSGNAVLAMYRKTRSTLPDQLITYSFVRSLSSSAANFTYEFYYGIQRTQQDPISLTSTTNTVYRDEGNIIQGVLANTSPIILTTDTSKLSVGDRVLGVGLPDDAIIQSISTNASITISAAAAITTVAGQTQSLQVFPGSISIPSFAEDRHGRTYMFFGNGLKPQMLRTNEANSVDVGIESPLAVPGLTLALDSMFVERVDVYSGGGGYTQPPTLSFTGGGGSGATAVAILDGGVISAVEVTSGGSLYRSTPTITVAEKGSRGVGFVGAAVLATNTAYFGMDTAASVTQSGGPFTAGNTYASSMTTSGVPIVTQIGPASVATTVAIGSNNVVLTVANFQIIPGMAVTGSGIAANTIVTSVTDSTNIEISSAVTGAANPAMSFTNAVTLTYDSSKLEYFGFFPFLYATAYGTGGLARIAFVEIKTGYQLPAVPVPTTSGSLNPSNALYNANSYVNLGNNVFYGLVASQSTYRWGNWTRDSYRRGWVGNIFYPTQNYIGKALNYWFPNYEFVSVWMHTGLKSNQAQQNWKQQECRVFKESATKAYIDVTLYPQQVSEGVASPLGPNFQLPVIRVFLAYAPASWDRTYADPFEPFKQRNAVWYQQITANGWLGLVQAFRPVVDFWTSSSASNGTGNGWNSTSFAVTNPGSGLNANATFLMRFAAGSANHQFGTADRNPLINATIPYAAKVEGGWGVNAFDITFTASTVETTTATISFPGAISTMSVGAIGAGYGSAVGSATVTLAQKTTAFVANGADVVITGTTKSYTPTNATDRIASVTTTLGGANYSGPPTFVINSTNGSGYGAQLSADIVGGVIKNVKVIDGGHGFSGAAGSFPVSTLQTEPSLMAVMRPTFKGVYSCAYRYADWTDTVVGTCYVCSDTGASNRMNAILDDVGASLIKTGYVLDGGLFRFHARAVSVIKNLVGLSLSTTNRPSNSTLTKTAVALTSGNLTFTVSSPATMLAVGMGVTNANIPIGATITNISGLTVTISLAPTATAASTSVVFTRILPVVSQIGTLTSGSALVTLLSTIGLQVGQHVRGTGIPDNTYILGLVANTSITLTNPSTVTVTVDQTLQCGWLTTIRDMSRPITYSNFSPIGTVGAGPTAQEGATGRLTWSWDSNVLTPERAQIVELWRTNGDQSLVFYRSEMFAVATPNTTIVPVANIVGYTTTVAGVPTTYSGAQAALQPQNALRGYASGTTDFDALSDEGLFLPSRRFYAALPVVLPNGGLNAYRFDQPRTDMRVCAAYNDRLWYAVSTSGLDTNTIFFSEYDEFESCPETNALTIQSNQKLTDSLTALMPYGSVLLAAQENHTYQVAYSTDPAVDANISMLAHRGLYNQRCWDIYDDEIYCLDRRGMYTMTQAGAVTNICAAVESYWIDNLIESKKTELFFIKIDSRAAIVRAFVVVDDANAPGPNLALCYSINTKTWWTETYPNSLTASSSYKPESTKIHDDVYSAIDGNIYALSGQNDLGYRSIVSVSLTNGGSGYVTPPKVVPVSLQGSGAKFQALLKNGVVSDIIVTDRGTDYGVLTNYLGNQGTWLTNAGNKFVFTSPVGHLLVANSASPQSNATLQRYTDNTYRTIQGTEFVATVIAVQPDPTAVRIPFSGNVNNTVYITVVDPSLLEIGQYLDAENSVLADSWIKNIVGNVIELNQAVGTNGSNLVFHAYAPRRFRTEPIIGWDPLGFVSIAKNSTTIISQEFNNQVALLIDAPTNGQGTQAAATAYCQNPPSEYTVSGTWTFTPDSNAALNGVAVIEFINNHTFSQGQQVPIAFADSQYTSTVDASGNVVWTSPISHSPNDQNVQSGAPSNWYVKEITEKTITVMAAKIAAGSETTGFADCTNEGLPDQFFTVGSQYKTGALELISDDNTPKVGSNFMDRSITVLYQPTSESKSLVLREYYNNSESARINQMARNRGTGFIHELNGAQAVLNMSVTRSALGAATGVAKAIFGSRTAADMSGADTHIAIELIIPSELITEDTQLADPPELYGLTVNGIVENGST